MFVRPPPELISRTIPLFLPLFLGVGAALAQTPPESPGDPELAARVAALEAELATMKQQQQQAAADDFMREAEALAGSDPPPPPTATPPKNIMNPRITAFGDGFASVGSHNGSVDPRSGPWLRSLEFDVREAVDPYANAVAIFALEQEDPLKSDPGTAGEFSVSPEEVYLDLVSLPRGFSARVGKFRQPFGLVNRTHPHDLPWTGSPLVTVGILGDEGFNDTGLTVDWRIPSTKVGATFTGGVLSGQPWDPASETATPGWLGRAELFKTFGNVDVALGGTGTGLRELAIGGADLTLRWKPSQSRSVTLLAEGLANTDGAKGAYASLLLQPARPVYFALRGDWFAPGTGPQGKELSAAVSYYTSEFLRVRASLSAGDTGDLRGDLQFTFVWGSHPIEPYWVNK